MSEKAIGKSDVAEMLFFVRISKFLAAGIAAVNRAYMGTSHRQWEFGS